MAGRSSFESSLTFYLIICLFLAQVTKFCPQGTQHSNLQILMATKDVNEVKLNIYPSKSTPRSLATSMANATKTIKLICFIRLLNTAMIANVILLSNDIQQNPGPGPIQHREMRGLRLFHLNICSLRNKMDELRLFCETHKSHVLSINETWLDESFSDEEIWLPGFNLLRKDINCHGG